MTTHPITQPSRGFELSPEQLLFTTDEAAHALSVGRTTIYLLMGSGELRPVHIGRSCRISRAELERYVARLDARTRSESAPTAQTRPADRLQEQAHVESPDDAA